MSKYFLTFYYKIREIVCASKSSKSTMSVENKFYRDARIYWANVPATVNGVLGGFGHISDTDIEGSRMFIKQILARDKPPNTKLALDCGAGIGRVTKNLLFHHFEKVDLVEQDEKFIATALESIGTDNKQLGTLYKMGLQYFNPDKKYDVIWIQWVLGHLNDDDMCNFLERCRDALNENGVIIIKENITSDDELEYDEEDSSVTRPYELVIKIIEVAKLKVIQCDVQSGFPEDLYDVYMFALVPGSEIPPKISYDSD